MTTEVVASDFQTFEAKLLTIGGTSVEGETEVNAALLVEDGEVFDVTDRQMLPDIGDFGLSTSLHYAGQSWDLEIVDGWALNKDGVWNRHSWTWDGERIHSSRDFVAYFGVRLSDADATRFVQWNLMTGLPGYGEEKEERTESAKKIGEIEVEAGMCWIGDPCYVLHTKSPKAIGRNWDDFCKRVREDEDRTHKQFRNDSGIPGLGVVVDTGGDGMFPVYAKFTEDGQLARVSVVFIE